jgi:hypothetical protein
MDECYDRLIQVIDNRNVRLREVPEYNTRELEVLSFKMCDIPGIGILNDVGGIFKSMVINVATKYGEIKSVKTAIKATMQPW